MYYFYSSTLNPPSRGSFYPIRDITDKNDFMVEYKQKGGCIEKHCWWYRRKIVQHKILVPLKKGNDFVFDHALSMQKFLGLGSNPYLSSDNTRSLTLCAT